MAFNANHPVDTMSFFAYSRFIMRGEEHQASANPRHKQPRKAGAGNTDRTTLRHVPHNPSLAGAVVCEERRRTVLSRGHICTTHARGVVREQRGGAGTGIAMPRSGCPRLRCTWHDERGWLVALQIADAFEEGFQVQRRLVDKMQIGLDVAEYLRDSLLVRDRALQGLFRCHTSCVLRLCV